MHSAPTPLPLRVSQDLSSPSASVGDPFLNVNFSVDSRQEHAGKTGWVGFETTSLG